MKKIILRKRHLAIFGLSILLCLSGCFSEPEPATYYTVEDIETVLNSDSIVSEPLLEDISRDKYPEEEFLFNNHCFAFNRDMDYFLYHSARYDFLGLIVDEYPPQVVRTIMNNGQKSMYFVYETDKNTRVFIFFFESDGFQFTRGYPIIMKKTLDLDAFSGVQIGDSMALVEKIDPITKLYRKEYDKLSDELIQNIYVEGREKISTVHLLTDGIIRFNYTRDSAGEYIIDWIYSSENFVIPVLGGGVCYLIHPADYIS